MMRARDPVTIYEFPRDLWRRGRPPKGAQALARFLRQVEDPPGLKRALQLEDQGKTVPVIARELGVSERTVQRWFARMRFSHLDYTTLAGYHPHFGGPAQDASGRRAFALELRCPRCGHKIHTVAKAPPTAIAALLNEEFGRATCPAPACQRPGRFTLSRYVPLTISEAREWARARTRARRAALFERAVTESANDMLMGRSTQAAAGRQKPRKSNR